MISILEALLLEVKGWSGGGKPICKTCFSYFNLFFMRSSDMQKRIEISKKYLLF